MNDEISDRLSIAELAEQAGLTRRTIRYYVAEGLLPAPGGRGRRRAYTAEHLLWLQAIRRLKLAFLPLSEIRHRLSAMTVAERRALAAEAAAEEATGDAIGAIAPFLAAALAPARYPIDPSSPAPGAFLASGAALPAARQLEAACWPGEVAFQLGPAPTVPRPAEPTGEVWRRVTLAPGVELHYQASGDRRRDEAIAHLIRAASSILR
ncbi:MAG: MerR family transcriptional regulator [Chloroflexota bacterium]